MTAHRTLARYGFALAALFAASVASAEETVLTLSPAEKARLLDAAAEKPSKPVGEPAINGIGRGLAGIHGEVGMMIGTNGARGVYGSAVAPVGDNASVAIAYENSRWGRYR